jgi:hypothetical protein
VFLVWQRLEAATDPKAIDAPLSQYGAQPGRETASTVVIAKERLPPAVAFLEAKELAVQRIGEIACATARVDRLGRSIQGRPVFANEVFPGALVTAGASDSQREILEMQAFAITLELGCARPFVSERSTGAGFEGGCKQIERRAPPLGAGPLVQSVSQGRVDSERRHAVPLCAYARPAGP